MSLPERLATRTRCVRSTPSRSTVSVRIPTRVPFLVSGSTTMTLLAWIGASMVSIPPVRAPRPDWPTLVWRFMRCTPSTTTRSRSTSTSSTRPCLPLSRPAMTTTRSPFLIRAMSDHLRSEGDDAHELLVAQLAAHGAEDAGSARLAVTLEDDRGVLVESDVGPVLAAALLRGAHDDRLDDVALLDVATGDGVLDGGDDDVTDTGVAPAGASEHTDAEDLLRAGVVGDLESRLLLDHSMYSCRRAGSQPRPSLAERMGGWCATWPSRRCREVASAWSRSADASP